MNDLLEINVSLIEYDDKSIEFGWDFVSQLPLQRQDLAKFKIEIQFFDARNNKVLVDRTCLTDDKTCTQRSYKYYNLKPNTLYTIAVYPLERQKYEILSKTWKIIKPNSSNKSYSIYQLTDQNLHSTNDFNMTQESHEDFMNPKEQMIWQELNHDPVFRSMLQDKPLDYDRKDLKFKTSSSNQIQQARQSKDYKDQSNCGWKSSKFNEENRWLKIRRSMINIKAGELGIDLDTKKDKVYTDKFMGPYY